jgi:hypothetical protein
MDNPQMKNYYYNLIAMLIMAFSSLSYSGDPLFAPDYPRVESPGPSNYKTRWTLANYTNIGGVHASSSAAYDSIGCTQYPTSPYCSSPFIIYSTGCSGTCPAGKTLVCSSSWIPGICNPGEEPCPNGGHLDNTATMCTEVPWGEGPDPVECTAGQTMTGCAPGETGGTVMSGGCIYAATNVSNQWAVNGVQSRCGEWTNTGFNVTPADASLQTASAPDLDNLKPLDASNPASPPGIEIPADQFQDPQNGNDVDPLIDANLPDPDPENPQIDVSKLAKESTMISGVNKLITASQNVVTAVNNGMRQLYNKSQEQLNALLAASTKLSTIDGSVKGVGTAVTGVGTAVTGLSGGISDVKDSVDKITEQPTNPDEEIEEQEKEMGLIQPVAIDSTASCPADLSFSVLGYPMAFSFGLVCDGANMLRPLILSIAWLSAGVIFIGGVRNG